MCPPKYVAIEAPSAITWSAFISQAVPVSGGKNAPNPCDEYSQIIPTRRAGFQEDTCYLLVTCYVA